MNNKTKEQLVREEIRKKIQIEYACTSMSNELIDEIKEILMKLKGKNG